MRTRLRLLVGAALVTLITGASTMVVSPASAATQVFSQRIVTETVWVESLQHKGAYPKCDDGEVATGGGFRVAGTTDPAAYTVLVSAPLDNGWNVQLFLDSVVKEVELTGYVVCLKKAVGDPGLGQRIVTVESKAFGDYPAAVYPKCDKGEYATGGGYTVASINPTAYTVYVDEPLGNGWNVQVYSTHHPYVYYWGHVVCITVPGDVPVPRRVVTASDHAPGQVLAGVGSYCDEKTELATGGGFGVASINPYSYTVVGSMPAYTAWKAEVFLDGSPGDHLDIWSATVCLGNVLP